MRSVVKAIIMLPVRIILLPIELGLIMASWIAIFFTSMTEWIFNLVSVLLFSLCLFSKITNIMPADMFWQGMITCFVIFIIPYIAQWIIMRIMDLRFWVWDIITM